MQPSLFLVVVDWFVPLYGWTRVEKRGVSQCTKVQIVEELPVDSDDLVKLVQTQTSISLGAV